MREEKDINKTKARWGLSLLLTLCMMVILLPSSALADNQGTPAPTVSDYNIYANGAPLLLVAGEGNNNTVIYIDKDNDSEKSKGDTIFDPDGNVTTLNGDATGNDLSEYSIFGGCENSDLTGNTKITMLGGKVSNIYGGGWAGGSNTSANINGDIHVTISDGTVNYSVYGGGYADPGTVPVIVHEDGTREILRKSTDGGDTMTLWLDGSATLEIVDNTKEFKDVPENAWYAEAVVFTSSRDLFRGTDDKTFAPHAHVTRGMIVTLLHRLENELDAGAANFADVPSDAYYAMAVAWAAENGIAKGIGNNQYVPNREVTREELATLIYRFASTLGLNTTADVNYLSQFADESQMSEFAEEAMAWCVEQGIINGKGANTLDPRGSAIRAESAAVLMRFVNLILK